MSEKPLSKPVVTQLSEIHICVTWHIRINTLKPRQNGRHFADDTFKRIFFNENAWMSIKISLTFVLKGPINNIPVLVQIMTWRRLGDKPLSEQMVVRLPTHICVTRPQWVNPSRLNDGFLRQWPGSPLVQIVACPLYRLKQNEHLFIVSGISQTNCSEIWMQNPAFNGMRFESVCKWRLFSIVLYWIDLKHHR